MTHYMDVKHDDELFAARLLEVNREMDTLLHKTSRTRHAMDQAATEVRMGVPLHFYAKEEGSRAGSAAQVLNPLYQTAAVDDGGVIHHTLREDLTRGVVSAELKQWMHTHLPTLVAPLVDAQVQRHLQQLRNEVEDVQSRQTEVEQILKETTEQLRAHRRDMQAGLASMQRGVQRDADEHQRIVESRLNAWREEVQRIKDEMGALREQRRSETEQVDRRLDESLQRRQQQVQDTFADLEHELRQWRQALQRDIEQEAQAVRVKHDSLERHVAQLQGALSSTTNMSTRCTAELQRMMETAVARSSEVRRCRLDVNRLEMLVQCTALQTTMNSKVPCSGAADSVRLAKNNSKVKHSSPQYGGESSCAALPVVVSLAQEVAHVNDKMQTVVTRIDGLYWQVRQLDAAFAREMASAVPRSSLLDNIRDVTEESLFSRSSASTLRPNNTQLSNVLTGPNSIGDTRHVPSTTSSTLHDSSINRNVATAPHDSFDGNSSPSANFAAQPVGAALKQPSHAASPSTSHGSLHRVDSVTMRARPEPYAASHPPTAHIGTSSLHFEDDTKDPYPMPIVNNGRSTPGVMPSRTVASRGFAGAREGSSPPQRRAPPRVIPVELSAPPSLAIEKQAAASGTSFGASSASHALSSKPIPTAVARAIDSSNVSSNAVISEEDSNGENRSHTGNAEQLEDPPSASTSGLYGELHTARSIADQEVRRGGGDDRVTATNPGETSTVTTNSSTSPSDSYVSDTPVAAEETPVRSPDQFGRYIPAPTSDSEEERDNAIIFRSALD
ncbi:hypothetical protein ABL78_7982 [Leptomonas seymouri]|uniref:Uncharacterized protein n=1 Tax=Leptomonas seymouri TaxID=5684 RepID=A0A0N1I179_LEPSE|nr:hypothetical protein ABL78_7982 [Leptomonas seymouri]|eukprot:KPI83001.1 hypothetical protein ABL78_7982 [Leptomonas seymouri]